MKKFSISALIIAIMMVITACTSPAGLTLKEATLKQLDLESFESTSTVKVDIDTAAMKNVFEIGVDSKQVDLLNSSSAIKIDPSLLALAGLDVQLTEDDTVTFTLISNNGDSILTSSQDEVGLVLSDTSAIIEGELGEGKEEEFQEVVLTMQEIFTDLIKEYIENYSYTLSQIENHGEVAIDLPNGKTVTTEHIEVQFSILDLIDMLQYSLSYFLEDEEIQQSFYEAIAELPMLMGDFVEAEEELNLEDIQNSFMEEVRPEVNAAIEAFITQLEGFKTSPLLENEELANDFANLSLHSYIGKKDKETYQSEFFLNLTYTQELAQLNVPELEDVPFVPGDSITLSGKDLYWNHNEVVDPIEIPSQLISIEELAELESAEEVSELLGENSLLAPIAESFMSVGEFGFIELKMNENKAETMYGEIELPMYVNDDNQLMAPLSVVGTELGAEVTWVEDTKQILVSGNGHLLDVTVTEKRNNSVTFDGEVHSDLFVDVINGTSYINIRTFAESMGWEVEWIPETKSVVIFN